jgi:hypothetical protein
MAFDKRGDLWIIQRGNDFRCEVWNMTSLCTAAVKCYKTDGTFTGREISDVVCPRALGYDAANDPSLVAENGPDVNVRIYGGLEMKPTPAKTFGVQGGIYVGRHPGLVSNPESGGFARFAGISGVGVDAMATALSAGDFRGRNCGSDVLGTGCGGASAETRAEG